MESIPLKVVEYYLEEPKFKSVSVYLTQDSTLFVVVVQSLSCVELFVTLWTAAHQPSLSFTISQSLLKFISIELIIPCNHLSLCLPFLFLPSILPSIKGFSNELAVHIRGTNYWSLSIGPVNEY